jgi:hypothetical protein
MTELADPADLPGKLPGVISCLWPSLPRPPRFFHRRKRQQANLRIRRGIGRSESIRRHFARSHASELAGGIAVRGVEGIGF